jgi:hypothetical protein
MVRSSEFADVTKVASAAEYVGYAAIEVDFVNLAKLQL